MKKRTSKLLSLLLTLTMVLGMIPVTAPHVHAGWRDDWEWGDEWNTAKCSCEFCGHEYEVADVEDAAAAESALEEYFCDDCGGCSYEGNDECFMRHHCAICGDCLDDADMCDGCADNDVYAHWDCIAEIDDSGVHCPFCKEHYGAGVAECNCEYSIIAPHCEDCCEEQCANCGICLVLYGEETECITNGGCLEHGLCVACIQDDPDHCKECWSCDTEVCSDCGLCAECTEGWTHCPECGSCFGDEEYDRCEDGGEHCVLCCEDNEWRCEKCGQCMEALGLDKCDDCGLCTDCCLEVSEEENCTHGYCIWSSEYEEHLCPECGVCPDDNVCDDCGLCEECQADYHCEHEYCPDSSEWEDHLCADCGECCDPDDLCDWCGMCPDCQEDYHCEHGVCPEDPLAEDDGDHFTCAQCGNCGEGADRCPDCGLCVKCCADNTKALDCEHEYCVVSSQFVAHWCYADDQCADKCEHGTACEHTNVTEEWSKDDSAHWHVCLDCGASVDEENHKEGALHIVQDPDPINKKNGVAETSCSVCGADMGLVSVPYVTPPTDGKPYIITQPKDYTGRTNTSANVDGGECWATFRVVAGGEGLTYQWYEKSGSNPFKPLEDDEDRYQGTDTATLRAVVMTDACDGTGYKKYYCVVTNSNGSVTTRTAEVNAKHVFGHYENYGDSTYHSYYCLGECGETKGAPEKHRYSAWETKAPTATEAGYKQQKCYDCGHVNKIILPALGDDHVHSFTTVLYGLGGKPAKNVHWKECVCGTRTAMEDHTFDAGVVTKQPTYKETGVKTFTCTVCGWKRTEVVPCKPHTHDFWEISHENCGNPQRGGRNAYQHWTYCKTAGCPENVQALRSYTERHDLGEWEYYAPNEMARGCAKCGYIERKKFADDQYPVTVVGGTAEPLAAKAGEPVTVTFTQVPGQLWKTGRNGSEWKDLAAEDSRWIPVESLLKPNKNNKTVTFVMPAPVGAKLGVKLEAAYLIDCEHEHTEQVGLPATCTAAGHTADTVCSDCGEILGNGTVVPALGHDIDYSTPVRISEAYCSTRNATNPWNPMHHWPNTKGYTWYQCTRCEKQVAVQDRPLVHGLQLSYADGTPTEIILAKPTVEGYVQETCTRAGKTGNTVCNYCKTVLEKSERIDPCGHEWYDDGWEVLVPATPKTKGQEIRYCGIDDTHTQRRVTDYSGPDYDLRTNKTKIHFDFTYGDPVEPVEITYRSVGRDTVEAINTASDQHIGGVVSVEVVDGMKLRISPYAGGAGFLDNLGPGEHETVAVDSVKVASGVTNQFTASQIQVTGNVKKTAEKYNITVEGGEVRVGANQANTMQLRGGESIMIIADDGMNFARWEIVEDNSGLIAAILDDVGLWQDDYFYCNMSPNDVTVRALYENDVYTVSFDKGEGSGSMADAYVKKGDKLTLPACTFKAPDGKEFDRWDKGAPGTEIDVNGNITVTALWKTKTPTTKTLEKIEVTTPPNKTEYTEGDSFDPTGMTVEATYSDGSSAPVTGYTVSPTGALTISDTIVTVTYTEDGVTKTTTQAITVNAAPKTLSSIAVTTPPTKTTYTVGENFNPTGMVVTATYSDTTTAAVIGYTVTDGTALTAGKTSVTISYTEGGETKTTTQSITVNEVLTEFTITFDGNGGTPSTSSMTTTGQKLTSLPTATRSGSYSFDGWYTAASGGTKVTTSYQFSADTTVYAHWTYTGGSSSGGGVSTYAITVDSAKNGDVTTSHKTASKGTIVTLTVEPDKGYTLETITVTDKNGDEIALTNKGDGKYTFKMPASKVYVEATFMEDNSMLNFFVDVPADAYYYDAVLWAAENGITGGVDDTHFAPNATCTRAQIVTFLWRAAGSPEPKSNVMPFEDVAAEAYYYKAVLWAVENGITKGTSATTFSPDADCTRAQIVTFLWRAQKSPAAIGVNPFTDVAADAYYVDAVLWAVEEKVTNGTSATTFSPDADCTRAQIVTFLYRALNGEE